MMKLKSLITLSDLSIAERFFRSRGYMGRRSSPDYIIIKGKVPVLLSAPHAVMHYRNGALKNAEILTGALAYVIARKTGCSAIIAAKYKERDPNFDEKSPFRDALFSIAKQTHSCLLLDLHGMNIEREFAIEIGTNNGLSLLDRTDYSNILLYNLQSKNLGPIAVNSLFKSSGENRISSLAAKNVPIPSIQLEIRKDLRSCTGEKGKLFANTLADFIQNIAICDQSIIRTQLVASAARTNEVFPLDRIEISATIAKTYGITLGNMVLLRTLLPKSQVIYGCVYLLSDNTEGIRVSNRILRNLHLPEDFCGELIVAVIKSYETSPAIKKSDDLDKVGTDIGSSFEDILSIGKSYTLKDPLSGSSIDILLSGFESRFKKSVVLSRDQRGFLGCGLPRLKVPNQVFKTALTLPELTEEERQELQNSYITKDDHFILKPGLGQAEERLKVIEKRIGWNLLYITPLQLKTPYKSFLTSIPNSILKVLIGTRQIQLKVVHPYPADESTECVRLFPDIMNSLGISSGEKANIYFRGKIISVRVQEFDNIESMLEQNGTNIGDEHRRVIGIPSKSRLYLDLPDIGYIVNIERDPHFLFIKNLNTQFFSILATVFTIVQTISNPYLIAILIIILVPLSMYLALSQERGRV